MRLIIALVILPSFAWGNACTTAQSGNWSASSTWSACGSTTPQTGDTAQILASHVVTLDTSPTVQSISIFGAGGKLQVDGASAHTITCNSASADCIGMANGTLDTSAGSYSNTLTIVAPNLTSSYFAVSHDSGSSSVVMKIWYAVITNVGTGNAIKQQKLGGTTDTIDVKYCDIENITASAGNGAITLGGALQSATVQFTKFRNISISSVAYGTIYASGTCAGGGACYAFSYNTEAAPVQAHIFFRYSVSQNFTMTGNYVESSGFSISLTMANGNALSSAYCTVTWNIGHGISDTASSAKNFIQTEQGTSVTSCLVDHNMSEYWWENYAANSYTNLTNNWGAQEKTTTLGQGVIFAGYYGTNDVNISASNNVDVLDTNNGNIGEFYIGNTTLSGVTVNNETVVGTAEFGSGSSAGLQFGETGFISTNNYVRDNLVYSWNIGIEAGTSTSTFVSSCAGSVGVCNNNVWGQLGNTGHANYQPNGATNFGAAPYYDVGGNNGTISAQFVTTSRRLAQCDGILFNGPGTESDLFGQFEKRWNGTQPVNATPQALYQCLTAGFAPQNLALATAATTGSYVGAIPPVVIGAYLP